MLKKRWIRYILKFAKLSYSGNCNCKSRTQLNFSLALTIKKTAQNQLSWLAAWRPLAPSSYKSWGANIHFIVIMWDRGPKSAYIIPKVRRSRMIWKDTVTVCCFCNKFCVVLHWTLMFTDLIITGINSQVQLWSAQIILLRITFIGWQTSPSS